MRIFQSVKKALKLTLPPLEELDANHILDMHIQAAMAKCIEFNIAANRTRKDDMPAFILMSNLRGICEDLIWLSYLLRQDKMQANKLLNSLLLKNFAEGISAQSNFFANNNPLQPILGNRDDSGRINLVRKRKAEFLELWRSITGEQSIPNVRKMAKHIGLESTYEFIYHAASNFVHFNPSALLRTGWGGPNIDTSFSMCHMNNYYRSFSSFYGAILFVGFCASFGEYYPGTNLDTKVAQIIELIDHRHRWPEIITFEEMNERPPLYLLTHALREVMREDDDSLPYGTILQEVQRLKQVHNSS